ncbi:hypothetical protein [Antarcticirhabdus aurantiaca]|uniref:Uncharacterized protein n=1 Tax=Antarcticirhabdus aurantiaca TaxID=2606717 RepID=A0ACD4NM00_9HYPH|nr:hypothetical protein [Antarcticirhabdus aurantiaca]WAJ27773.1 hypothetical protein OXU80_23485 [Jeongeuplla avenae]
MSEPPRGNTAAAPDFPEGLGDPHLLPRSVVHRHASPLSLVLLGALLALALLGPLGGTPEDPLLATSEAADLLVDTPRTLRNGMFFETRIVVEPKRDIGRLVLAISPELWRHQTQNTMVPAASEETFEGSDFRFDYGPVPAGQRFEVKLDLQINPDRLGGTRGRVAIFDGEAELASVPVEVKVLP